jgi:hypothetical protein
MLIMLTFQYLTRQIFVFLLYQGIYLFHYYTLLLFILFFNYFILIFILLDVTTVFALYAKGSNFINFNSLQQTNT